MDLVGLTEFLVKGLVKETDMVSVRKIEEEDEIILEVMVAEDDMGTVIGKGGSIANAIRTLVQATAYVNKLPKVKINIDSI